MNSRVIELKKQPTVVRIADKPLAQGGVPRDMPVNEFENIIDHAFMERIDLTLCDFPPSEVHDSITGGLSKKTLTKQLENLLENPRDDLVMCKINEEVGFGVFAPKCIPENTVLCFYAGALMPVMKEESKNSHAMHFFNSNAKFSTEYFRGIASFFQHFPSSLKMPDAKSLSHYLQRTGQQVSEQTLKMHHELYSVEFLDKDIKEQLAIENVRHEYIRYRGMPVILLVTNREIKANEQLGFDYGEKHWLCRGIVPELFNASSEIIPHSAYIRTFYQLKFDGFTYTGELLPLIKQLTDKNHHGMVKLIADNKQTKEIDASVVLEELFRVRAIIPDEYQVIAQSLYQRPLGMGLFSTRMTSALVKKYELFDASQVWLEKGLRKAAVNNEPEDLKRFIKIVHNVNAQDANPEVLRTALHWAAVKNHPECYAILLAHGAIEDVLDAKGKCASQYLEKSPLALKGRE